MVLQVQSVRNCSVELPHYRRVVLSELLEWVQPPGLPEDLLKDQFLRLVVPLGMFHQPQENLLLVLVSWPLALSLPQFLPVFRS